MGKPKMIGMFKPYQVFNSDGEQVMESDTRCRYPRHIELNLLEAGYAVRIDGKRLTKTELRREIKNDEAL